MLTIICAFLLLTLASARVTRLVVTDGITRPIRKYIVLKYGVDGWLTDLVHCPFCVSVWTSLVAAAFWCAFTSVSWVWYLPAVLAMSYLVAPILIKFDPLKQED